MRVLVVSLLFVAVSTFAVEPLASDALIEQCSSTEDASIRACRAWVHGFMGGAFATRAAKYVDSDRPETYSERARRTRISRGREIYGRDSENGYCVPSETTLDEIVDKLVAHTAGLEKVPEQANQLMLGLLRKQYPCR